MLKYKSYFMFLSIKKEEIFLIKKFSKYYKPHMKLFIVDFTSAAILAILSLVFPLAVSSIIDTILPSGDLKALFTWGGILLALYIANYFLAYIQDYWGHYLGTVMEYDMRKEMFEKVHKLPFSYFDNTKTGQIMSRIVNDLNEISEMAHHAPEDMFTTALTFMGAIIIMFFVNWKLALILLLVVPFMAIFAIRQNKKMRKGWQDLRQNLGDINSQVEDSITGVRVVKSFTNEEFEIEKFNSGNTVFTKSKSIAYKNMSDFYPVMDFFANSMYLVVLMFGGFLVYSSQLTIGNLVSFILYVGIFLQPIRKIANLVDQYQRGMASFSRFVEVMEIEPAIQDDENAVDIGRAKGEVVLSNVTFGYNDHRNILKNINIKISAGETIAVVGPSGGGKTTLCNLIPRFYEIDEGDIFIDGTNIRKITQKSLRKNIGNVQQDVFLFSGTIKENLQYGRMDATMEEIIEAAKQAEAHDFIMKLENGYDTVVGERGIKLSGGQKQRIAIARIFLKNPPILILDEATSALDNETEMLIQKSLFKLSENRTTLVIAHRLTTIKNADRIIVLTDEGIVEEGSHEELIEKNGAYTKLYNSQYV